MSDAYRQKLAKKIAEIVVCNPDKEFSDRISAVLAAEGVVDPEEVNEKWSDAYATAENRITNLEQQLAALKAKLLGTDECLETWKSAAEKWEAEVAKLDAEVERLKEALDLAVNEQITYFDGMERAAVIVEQALGDNDHGLVAAAIRAKIKP